MADRQAYPPPVKCSSRAKRTGERCERWSVPGRLQCKLHGAYAGQAGKAAAEERAGATVTIATMLANNPGRPVWEVIRDTIRAVDLLFQAAQNDVAAGQVSADSLDRMASLARQAYTMAASAVAARALDLATQIPDRWGDLVVSRLVVLLDDWLGLPSGSHAITAAISATLGELDLGDPSPTPRPDGPSLMDQVGHAQAAALAPRLGLPPAALAVWLGRVLDAVADGRPAPALPGGPVAALPPAPEPGPAPVLDAEPPTLQSAGSGVDPAQEPEIVNAEILDDEPDPERQPRRIFDAERRVYVRNPAYQPPARGTSLGYQPGGPPTMPTSYREFR